jgi:hypothetical protein
MRQALRDFHAPTDRALLGDMLRRAAALPPDQRLPAVDAIVGGGDAGSAIDRFLDHALAGAKVTDEASLQAALAMNPEALEQLGDPWIGFAKALYPTYRALRETQQRREGALSRLQALYVDAKQRRQSGAFLPDANGTLRLTLGRVRGYSPADAVVHLPFTTLRGVVDKTTGREPYASPPQLLDLARDRVFGRFAHPTLRDVPVAMLYDLDTTGGNSGSPVMNARGELVGVNFDRTFDATINDYAWSESYSRSIGVDVRYVLWVTGTFGGATRVLQEMGITP